MCLCTTYIHKCMADSFSTYSGELTAQRHGMCLVQLTTHTNTHTQTLHIKTAHQQQRRAIDGAPSSLSFRVSQRTTREHTLARTRNGRATHKRAWKPITYVQHYDTRTTTQSVLRLRLWCCLWAAWMHICICMCKWNRICSTIHQQHQQQQ